MRSAGIIPDYATFIDALYGRGLFGRKTYYAEVFKLVCEKLSVNSVRDLDRCIKATRDPERDQCGLPLSPSQIFDFSTIQQTIISLFLQLGRFEHETGIDEMFQTGMIPYFWEEV